MSSWMQVPGIDVPGIETCTVRNRITATEVEHPGETT